MIFRPQDRGNGSGVGGETRLKHHARLGALEIGDPLLQLHVDAHGAGDGADRARSSAELLRRFHLRLDQFGMVRQAEIVVARQIDHLAAIEARDGFAGRFEDTQALVRAGFAPGF